jgi:hypothetical protein
MLNPSLSMETDTIFFITVVFFVVIFMYLPIASRLNSLTVDAGYVQYKYRSWHKLLCFFLRCVSILCLSLQAFLKLR